MSVPVPDSPQSERKLVEGVRRGFWRGLLLICLSLALGAAVLGYYVALTVMFTDMEMRGQFGDSFGAFNAIVSSVSLVLVAFSLLLQRRDFNLQVRETAESDGLIARALSPQANTVHPRTAIASKIQRARLGR